MAVVSKDEKKRRIQNIHNSLQLCINSRTKEQSGFRMKRSMITGFSGRV